MKIVTLLENTSRRPGLTAARGLSLYAETAERKVLFDMGPDEAFLENARALGVDLAAVDTAVLSHGHSDHGGGLSPCRPGRSPTTSACPGPWSRCQSASSSPGTRRTWGTG